MESHWFFGTMSPDIIEAASSTLGALALGILVAIVIGSIGSVRR